MGPRDNHGNPFLSWYPRASENDHRRGFPRACCRVSRPGSGDRRETAVPAAALLATEPGHQLSPLLPKIRLGVGLHRRRHACLTCDQAQLHRGGAQEVLDPDHAIPRHDLNVGCAERQKQELCLCAALLPPRAVSPDTPSRSSTLWRPPAADSLVPPPHRRASFTLGCDLPGPDERRRQNADPPVGLRSILDL